MPSTVSPRSFATGSANVPGSHANTVSRGNAATRSGTHTAPSAGGAGGLTQPSNSR